MRDPVLAKLEERFQRAAKARKPVDVEWILDIAFFSGKQYTEFHTPENATGYFRTIPREKGQERRPRVIANKINHFVMDSYASAKEHRPDVEVMPQNSDAMMVSNAKVAQAWLDHITFPTQANWLARSNAARFWAVLVGEGWNKWVMPPGAKRPTIEFCSPLEIYLPPACLSYLDAPWLIHSRAMDPEDVFDAYGKELPASAVDQNDPARHAVLREVGMASDTPVVTVKEIWETPCRRYPEGRFAVWAGEEWLIEPEAFPYKHGMLPFTQIGHTPIPGTPRFHGPVKVMRPLQMELNDYHTQKTVGRKKHTNHKWFLDTTLAESMVQMPDDSSDQIVVGDSKGGLLKPEILQAQLWPDGGDGDWIAEEMRDAIGLHEASQGAAPGRVDSAQGIEALQEADKGRLSEMQDTYNIAVARGFGMLLELGRQYVSEDQIVADYSRDGAPAVHHFKTSDFPSQPMLRVVSGDGLPKNKSARRAEVISMWSAGLLGDNPRRALDMLGFPVGGNFTPDEQDEMDAWSENMLMLRGIATTPKKWQAHDVHRRVHNECRKSAEFAAAPQAVWELFDFHFEDTDLAELQELQEEADRQAAIAAIAERADPEPATLDPTQPPPTEAPTAPQPGAAPA